MRPGGLTNFGEARWRNATSSRMSPAFWSATPTTRVWLPGSRRSFSRSRPSPRSTCAAARRARARPTCSSRIAAWSASTPWSCPAAPPSASMPAPACRRSCASKAAALRSATVRVPIVCGAALFDLLNGGDKNWGRFSPYRDLGYAAAARRAATFALGTAGAGFGATTVNLKGGLGSASALTGRGHTVGALVAVNACGSVIVGDGPHFWAAPFEVDGEFGGLGFPSALPPAALGPSPRAAWARTRPSPWWPPMPRSPRLRPRSSPSWRRTGSRARSTRPTRRSTATRYLRPRPAAGRSSTPVTEVAELGAAAANVLARAVARAVFEAESLPGGHQAGRNATVRHFCNNGSRASLTRPEMAA